MRYAYAFRKDAVRIFENLLSDLEFHFMCTRFHIENSTRVFATAGAFVPYMHAVVNSALLSLAEIDKG